MNKTSLNVPAFQEVTYHSLGTAEETYCPTFSIFGFRYVWLDGYEEEIFDGDFMAVAVYSDMEVTGELNTSHSLINQLIKNSL